MNLNLDNKLSLVTGSTAGIGYAIAMSLAQEGARVIVNGRSQTSVDNAVSRIKSDMGDNLSGFAGDLGIDATAEQLAGQFPDVEILVNNLGIFEPKEFEDITDADWRRFFDVNVLSGVRLARLFLPGPTSSRGVSEFADSLAKAEGKSIEAFEKEFFEKFRPTSHKKSDVKA